MEARRAAGGGGLGAPELALPLVTPDFTLTDTAGDQVSLADFRGEPVVLYFNEGAGCQSCFYQMVDIEQHADEFTAAGVTVLPVAGLNVLDILRHKNLALTKDAVERITARFKKNAKAPEVEAKPEKKKRAENNNNKQGNEKKQRGGGGGEKRRGGGNDDNPR